MYVTISILWSYPLKFIIERFKNYVFSYYKGNFNAQVIYKLSKDSIKIKHKWFYGKIWLQVNRLSISWDCNPAKQILKEFVLKDKWLYIKGQMR